jgi:hypothetical protein
MTAKKAKKKTFRALKAVKEAARNVIGSPKATVRQTPKTQKVREKHKTTLKDFLNSED